MCRGSLRSKFKKESKNKSMDFHLGTAHIFFWTKPLRLIKKNSKIVTVATSSPFRLPITRAFYERKEATFLTIHIRAFK